MWKKVAKFTFVFSFFITFFLLTKDVSAQTCSGYATCTNSSTTCYDNLGNTCLKGAFGCNCTPGSTVSVQVDCAYNQAGVCTRAPGGGLPSGCGPANPCHVSGGGGGEEEPPPPPPPVCNGNTQTINQYYECNPFGQYPNQSCQVRSFVYTGNFCPVGTQYEVVGGCHVPWEPYREYDQCGGSCGGNTYASNQSVHVVESRNACNQNQSSFQCSVNSTCPNGCLNGACIINTPTPTPTPCVPNPNSCGTPYCEVWNSACNGTNYTRSQQCTDTCGNTYYVSSCLTGTGSASCPVPTNAPPPTTAPPPSCGGLPTCGGGQHAIGPGQTCTSNSQCGGSYNWCYAGCCTACVANPTQPPTPTNVPGCRTLNQSCGLPGTCCSGLVCEAGNCRTQTTNPTSAPTVPPQPQPRCGQGCSISAQCANSTDGCNICSGGTCRTTAITPTPTLTRTPTPSPTPRNDEIAGRVYNTANDSPLSGVHIYYRQQGSTVQMTHADVTGADGRYSFNVSTGTTYEVRAILLTSAPQSEWTIVNPNAQGRYTNVSAGSTRNFGISTGATPTATPVPYQVTGVVFIDTDGDGVRDTGENGLGSAQISVSKPTGTACNGSRNWGPNSTPGSGAFSFANLCAGTYTVTIGSIPNGYQVISATTQTAILSAGTPTVTVNFAVGQTRTVTGTLRVDNDGPDCGASGSSPYNGGGTARLLTGATEVDSETISNGGYSLTTTRTGNNFHVVLSGLSGYAPNAYRLNGGACTTMSGFDFGPFNIPPNTNTIEFFVSNNSSWYQVGSGDVRMMAIQNMLPAGQYASIGNPTSIFYSSTFPANFGQGNSSTGANNRWVVSNEYSANSGSEARRGTVSYSYFAHQIEQQGTNVTELCNGSCTQDISALATGIYMVNGNLTITSYSHASGNRVTLLVDGDIFLDSNVVVPQGGLLFMLTSGDIVFGPAVGNASLSSQTSSVDGIYSAEGNIVIDGTGCSGGVPDLRLNVGGVLIANSLQPFSRSGGGVVDNRRSLCGNNANYPTYTVFPRYDFLFQLTEFYKVRTEEWREVAP